MGEQRPAGRVGRPRKVANVTSDENTRKRHRWTDAEEAFVLAHPEMSSRALALALGRTYGATRNKRSQLGRFSGKELCCACHVRPVWEEGRRARRMRLCKGCFEEEMARRDAEEPAANRRRQREFKRRAKMKP